MTRILIILALFLSGCATTEPEVGATTVVEPPVCSTITDHANGLLAQVPVAEVLFFEGARARQVIDRLNKMPPASDFTADMVLFATAPGRLDHVALFLDGCFIVAFGVLPGHRARWLSEPTGWAV